MNLSVITALKRSARRATASSTRQQAKQRASVLIAMFSTSFPEAPFAHRMLFGPSAPGAAEWVDEPQVLARGRKQSGIMEAVNPLRCAGRAGRRR